MTDEKKLISEVIHHINFVDKDGIVKIHCTRRCLVYDHAFQGPGLTKTDYVNRGPSVIYDYEVKNWVLEQNEDEMPLEHDYDGTNDWEEAVCEKYNLKVQGDEDDEYIWEDVTITFEKR